MSDQNKKSNEINRLNALQSECRADFEKKTDVDGVLSIVANDKYRFLWPNYQHYTTLSRLLMKLEGRWFLSRGDSTRLNDHQESAKFGDPEVMAHVWETCFSGTTSECAAMWSMYCKQSPFAVRVTIPNSAMVKWMARFENEKSRHAYALSKKMQKKPTKRIVGITDYGLYDLIYAATDFVQHKTDGLDKDRRDVLCWNQAFANLADIRKFLADDRVTGLVKDYEWRQEKESLLIVKTAKVERPDARIYIDVPKCVREKMHFTLSPWLERKHEAEVVELISEMLRRQGISPTDKIRRSVLSGALNLG